MLRQPIITFMGHVDHGKTSLLDRIRGSAVAAKEAGGITQAIGASIMPAETLTAVAGSLLAQAKLTLTIPGLLFIDTPGHAAFANLRKRGGNLADIAVLVIDIMDGFMPQTEECVQILKSYKTPFIIAANKVDLIDGWREEKSALLASIASQPEQTRQRLDTKLYELVGKLSTHGFAAERFDRVTDYTKELAIVPVSAKTGAGIPELLLVLSGLAQRFLQKNITTTADAAAKGTILEVKEERGIGTVLDAIIYDGTLKVNDVLVVGSQDGAITTRVKVLLQPAALAEMREKRTKFVGVDSVTAATGVRIVAPNTETAVAGMPLVGGNITPEQAEAIVKADVGEVIETQQTGIVIKADTLGSLEALARLLQERGIPVKKAAIGPVSKKDIADAEAAAAKDPLHAVILGFNIPAPEFTGGITILTNTIIYRLIEEYDAFRERMAAQQRQQAVQGLVAPCKIQLLPEFVFRQSNPAVVGIEVLSGTLKPNTPLMKQDGEPVASVKGIQHEQHNVESATKGMRVAIALPGVTIGRTLQSKDTLLSAVPEEHFRQYKESKQNLTDDEREALKEIGQIMRRKNPMWGV
ncbi:translation initiation factor IF-2 [Candidatus Woesearchaeota archaeon]|nr:translation initiation factor IF-2 [Candidatus Woesearchaeota archaeon]